jgi:hypothetical protein
MRAAYVGIAIAFVTLTRGAAAQNEGALRAAFEGKTIAVRIDMPATSQGVDVYPQDAMPVNFRDVAQRLKDNGTALKIGQQVMVTKVVVKKDHLEFQLGGGGYGTFGDWMTNGSDVSTVSAGETQRERDLRAAIKSSGDKDEKKRLQRELDNERSTRQRENSKAAAEAAQANIARESSIRAKRAESGSRFNVRYRQGMPPEALTPDGVMRALAQYAEFAGAHAVAATSAPDGAAPAASLAPAASAASAATAASGVAGLRKGQSLKDVETILGPAAAAAEVKDGSMTVQKRTYRHDGLEITASFVAGVLIDFAIRPA